MYMNLILNLMIAMIPVGNISGQNSPILSLDQWRAALRSIVQSEHAFAEAAAREGTREAFLDVLAEDALLFKPQPVPGRKWWLDHAPSSDRLTWWPVFADVSAGGDLGYSTGPYELRKNADDPSPASFGNYVTIWKRQRDGGWKVLLDHGAANPAPGGILTEFDPQQGRPPFAPGLAGDEGEAAETLFTLDVKVSDLASRQGSGALRTYYSETVRCLRSDRSPLTGIASVVAQLPDRAGIWNTRPMGSGCSLSGDLGYTYGSSAMKSDGRGGKSRSGYYLRIWRMQAPGAWKIVLELVND